MRALTHNKKTFIYFAIALMAVLVVYSLAFKPALDRINTLKRVIPEKRQTLEQLQQKTEQYIQLKAAIGQIDQNTSGDAEAMQILSSIENLASRTGLGSRMTVTKRSQSHANDEYTRGIIEVRFKDITLEELLSFTGALSSEPRPLHLDTIRLTAQHHPAGKIDADMHIQTVSKRAH